MTPTAAVIALMLLLPGSAWARGGHGGPTPTCRTGCQALSPEQVRQVRQHPERLPPGGVNEPGSGDGTGR